MLTDIATCFQNRGLKNRNLRGEGGEGAESCSGHNSLLKIKYITSSGVRCWVKKAARGGLRKMKKNKPAGVLLRLCRFEYFFQNCLYELNVEHPICS